MNFYSRTFCPACCDTKHYTGLGTVHYLRPGGGRQIRRRMRQICALQLAPPTRTAQNFSFHPTRYGKFGFPTPTRGSE